MQQSAHEFFKEIEANKSMQRYKEIMNIHQLIEKIDPANSTQKSQQQQQQQQQQKASLNPAMRNLNLSTSISNNTNSTSCYSTVSSNHLHFILNQEFHRIQKNQTIEQENTTNQYQIATSNCASMNTTTTNTTNTTTTTATTNKTSSSSSNIVNGIRLDPCHILKYSNQPFAIVAPNKSNSNTLEKKKQLRQSLNSNDMCANEDNDEE